MLKLIEGVVILALFMLPTGGWAGMIDGKDDVLVNVGMGFGSDESFAFESSQWVASMDANRVKQADHPCLGMTEGFETRKGKVLSSYISLNLAPAFSGIPLVFGGSLGGSWEPEGYGALKTRAFLGIPF